MGQNHTESRTEVAAGRPYVGNVVCLGFLSSILGAGCGRFLRGATQMPCRLAASAELFLLPVLAARVLTGPMRGDGRRVLVWENHRRRIGRKKEVADGERNLAAAAALVFQVL